MKKKLKFALTAAMSLVVKPITFTTAKYAVMNWHYSKSMPAGKLIKYGVWEDDKFIGAVIYGRGANNNMHKYLKCDMTECAELTRVALKEHTTPVTRIVAITLKMLRVSNPGIKYVFSYADETNQGHKGVIYKAGNWEYRGERIAKGGTHWLLNGRIVHNRSMSSKYGARANFPKEATQAQEQIKHLFVYNLRD